MIFRVLGTKLFAKSIVKVVIFVAHLYFLTENSTVTDLLIELKIVLN